VANNKELNIWKFHAIAWPIGWLFFLYLYIKGECIGTRFSTVCGEDRKFPLVILFFFSICPSIIYLKKKRQFGKKNSTSL